MSLVLNSSGGGSVTIQEPATASNFTQTLAAATGTLAPLVSGTAVTASGTAVDFTGIPSWAKRITVMFSGVSTNGTSALLVQVGAGSFQTTGYISTGITVNNAAATAGTNSTAGFVVFSNLATSAISANVTINTISANVWVSSYSGKQLTTNAIFGGGDVTLSGTLDRLRITTVNGTDTFDAGTINIMWE